MPELFERQTLLTVMKINYTADTDALSSNKDWLMFCWSFSFLLISEVSLSSFWNKLFRISSYLTALPLLPTPRIKCQPEVVGLTTFKVDHFYNLKSSWESSFTKSTSTENHTRDVLHISYFITICCYLKMQDVIHLECCPAVVQK